MKFGSHSEKFCCFHIITAAAVVGVSQVLVAALLISNSAAVYNRRTSEDKTSENAVVANEGTSNGKWVVNNPKKLNISAARDAFLSVSLANNIAVHAVWIVFLGVFALSFTNHNPIYVVPNIMMQILTLVWGFFMIGFMIAGVIQGDESIGFFATTLAFAAICWIVELLFLVVCFRYFKFLKDQHRSVGPTLSLALPSAFDHEMKEDP